MPQIPEQTLAAQLKETMTDITGGMVGFGQILEREAIQSGEIAIEELADPVKLNFGTFGRKTTFNHGCRPDLRLQAAAEIGGVDEIAIAVKKPDGGDQVVEIGHNPRDRQKPGIASHGDPESDFVLVIHEDNAQESYFVGKSDISKFARRGEPFQFGSEESLGEVFSGGIIEKVVGFSEPVPLSQPPARIHN